jgi:NitT/TauT family transport system substrate-binding protein
LIVVVIIILAGLGAYVAFQPRPNHNVNFMVDFALTGYHGLFFYGLEHGIYSKSGLNVTILPGTGSVSVISALAAGKIDFALADSGTLALAAANSSVTNVRIVAMVFQVTSASVIYNKARISSISDLNGKTMGSTPGSGLQKIFKVFAKINNLNQSSIRIVYANPSVYVTLVALGQTDSILAVVSRFPDLRPLAAENKITLGQFRFADYGLNIYGNAIMANTAMINDHPATVRSFVQATLESIQGATQHPKDAVTSLMKYAPQLNATLGLEDFQAITQYSLPPSTNSTSNAQSLGWIDPSKMEQTASVILQGYGIDKQLNMSLLYTNQFVQRP